MRRLRQPLAESTIGLYKTEINRRGSWKTLAQVQPATFEWVDGYKQVGGPPDS